ncbi:hypothetical protein I316_02003 [Kwoniella heveanensis BCC8398]|uniref:Uncharacterized protein n=1 Tax=Kwoniella heveanensis BCC8398 TaxID=1296120 RepID=A0A1B9GYM4_9TREE|nr:hypothetical protein I316_02003 [Kwoniella heveanensis BCC8398]
MSPASIGAPLQSSLPTSTSAPSLPRSNSSTFVSPAKPSTPKSYHPYAIQSTASANLTRSNSSPAQPIGVSGGHRPSRSMSSLNQFLNQDLKEKDGPTGTEKDKEDRRKSMDMFSSPSRPGVRRSGTLPDFLMGDKRDKVAEKDVDLPMNPKQWTPSELAQYLGHTLRTGGHDGTGHVLPAPLVEDIKSWVLRQRVSGRAFIRGSTDGWGSTTRPPPFLPLLQTIARLLRRSLLSGRIDLPVTASADDSFGRGSVLLEEDEAFSDDEGDAADITGVRRMAIAFDARSSASDASNASDDGEAEAGLLPLKAQWTGESVGERWKKWEDKVQGRKRTVSNVSDVSSSSSMGAMGDVEFSPRPDGRNHLVWRLAADKLERSEEAASPDGEEQGKGGTIKAHPPSSSGPAVPLSTPLTGLTPPPPYTSSFPDATRVSALPTLTEVLTPERPSTTTSERGGFSVTPTPERPSHNGLGLLTPSSDVTPSKRSSRASQVQSQQPDSPHMAHMSQHSASGNDQYAALRRRSSSGAGSGPRYPTVRSLALSAQMSEDEHEEEDEEEVALRPAKLSPAQGSFDREELEGSRWTAARRVTLRPGKVQSIFDEGDGDTCMASSHIGDAPREKGGKMEEQMERLMERIKELEDKLEAVTIPASTPVESAPPSMSSASISESNRRTNEKGTKKVTKKETPSLLEILGLTRPGAHGSEDDGLPRQVRELPVYLFFVGVGVGAVMVRVIFGSGRGR